MWETTADARAFLDAAGAFLRSRPVEHTVLLTVSDRVARSGAKLYGSDAPLFGWWTAGDEIAGAFLHTPPFHVLIAAPPPAAAELAHELRAAGREVGGVNAAEPSAEAFAEAFGRPAELHQRHRLHRLDGLVPPDPAPPGAARVASADDRELLEAWMRAFAEESGDHMGDVPAMVEDKLSHGGFTLWHAEGATVSMAGHNRAMEGAVRIGPVYTPSEHRRRGYGAGVTAAAAARALEDGAREVLLFTDLANPTSNALYRRLGFEPLPEDRVLLSFR